MFYFKSILIVLAFPVITFGQSVSVSLPSFSFWGQAEMIGHVSAEYKNIGVHYFHNFEGNLPYMEKSKESSIGLSFTPINIKGFSLGVVKNNKPFPKRSSSSLNFILDAGFNFHSYRVSYTHISNGFGLQNKTNTGFDTITLRKYFN